MIEMNAVRDILRADILVIGVIVHEDANVAGRARPDRLRSARDAGSCSIRVLNSDCCIQIAELRSCTG